MLCFHTRVVWSMNDVALIPISYEDFSSFLNNSWHVSLFNLKKLKKTPEEECYF